LGGKFGRCQSLNPAYDVYWNVAGNDLTLALHLRGYPKGWVGIGTSVNGGMRGADIAVARMVNGEYVLEDRFVPGVEGEPKIDDHQDLTLISATSDNTSLTVIFTRKIIPCDVTEDVPILEHATPIIFAYGNKFGYHGVNRGSSEVYFHYVPADKLLPNDTEVVRLMMPAYEVPAKDTTYTCTPIELPYVQKYHVVRWRPVITPSSEPYVHHMVIFVCPRKETGAPYECGMAPQNCQGFLIAWSLGQTGNDWLDDYALPIGGANGPRYGMLQIHYNNPNEVAGIVDSSGIELFYTSQLRQFDMGSLTITTNMRSIFIPPFTDGVSQEAECPSECTQKYPHPIYIVNYFPHMHEIGQKIWTQHIRNGTELAEIHRDDHYDFQRQQSYSVNVTILPGDRMKLHCVWDAMNRDWNTTGGESSRQEMCVLIMQYYPIIGSGSTIGCTDSGNGTRASCSGTVLMAPYNYTPLPEPVSTCTDEEGDKGGASAVLPFFGAFLVVLLLAL